jgi:antitoxin FitA
MLFSFEMPSVQVRDVPAELHRRLRERARDERMSISEYVLDLLERDLALPTRREWSDRLATRASVEVDVVGAIQRGRDERDAELSEAGRR